MVTATGRRPGTRRCVVCDARFVPRVVHQLCCGPECGIIRNIEMARVRRRRGEAPPPAKQCEHCGMRFVPATPWQRMCARKACQLARAAAGRRRRRAAMTKAERRAMDHAEYVASADRRKDYSRRRWANPETREIIQAQRAAAKLVQ